ncbi:MAG TPA: hypothetical protein VMX75_14705, partial [Spirochaetia bacterium]|nr:hypothetical protein [Spirochaetia bacterium]
MSWRIYTKTDLPNLLAFLKGEEWKCVALSSRIKDAIGRPFANVEMHSFLVNEKKVKGSPTILEAIMLTRYGLILPLLRDELTLTLGHNRPFMALLNRYKSRLHSVMGPSKGVLKIERLLGINPNARIEYHLMTRDLTDFRVSRAPAPRNVKIRLAHPEDADILYHLQKGYEIEEVFLDP